MRFPEQTLEDMARFRPESAQDEPGANEEETEYTIEQLALAANLSVRNIRAYQDKELLPPPELRGRKGIYSNRHLSRLRVITRLLERGYSLAAIRDLIAGLENGYGLREMLGMESAINSPWSDEAPTLISLTELGRLFGTQLTPANIAKANALGLVKVTGTQARVASMRTLQVAAQLCETGIPLSVLLGVLERVRANIEQVADEFVGLISEQVLQPYEQQALIPKEEFPSVIDLIWKLRPMAEIIIRAELGRAMDISASGVLADQLESLLRSVSKAPDGDG